MAEATPSVLIVDDELDICRNLADILEAFGYEAEYATDGPSALERVRQRPYDVALLDLRMPGMDGLTLYREIKKLRPGVAAIVVTAYASSETAGEALQAGACQVLPKPVDMERLLGEVQGVVDQPLVLVVDDDAELTENLWDILHAQRYRVCVAHDADQAARQLTERDYRVVLLDLRLPGGDASALYRTIRRTNPDARTLLITGYRDEMRDLIEQVVQEGAEDVCYKPFDVDELLRTLARLARAQ